MNAISGIRNNRDSVPQTPLRRHVQVHRLVLAVGACLGLSHGAVAVSEASDPLLFDCHGCEVLGKAELAARRGGFNFAGMEFDFGVNIRSYLDNRLVLESLVNITTETTDHRVTRLPDQVIEAAVAENAANPPSSAGSAAPTTTPASQPPASASNPAQIDLSGLSDAMGVTVNDRKGFTSVLHQVTRERITSLVVNSASGRDIRQELDVRVNVRNFGEFQKAARQAILNSRISAARQR